MKTFIPTEVEIIFITTKVLTDSTIIEIDDNFDPSSGQEQQF